jgi:hypothetical protein
MEPALAIVPENRQEQAQRQGNGRFLPGCASPNPGGRPRIIADVQALARSYTTEAIETLVGIANDPKAPPGARVAAANALLDRGWGRSTTSLTIHQEVERASPGEVQDALNAAVAASLPGMLQQLEWARGNRCES